MNLLEKSERQLRDLVLQFWSSKALCSEKDSILCISAFKEVVLTIC